MFCYPTPQVLTPVKTCNVVSSVQPTDSTGFYFCVCMQCSVFVVSTEQCITVCLTEPHVRAVAAVGVTCQSLYAMCADAPDLLCLSITEL